MQLSCVDCQHHKAIITKLKHTGKASPFNPASAAFQWTADPQGPTFHLVAGLHCNLPWTGEAIWGECGKNANGACTKTRSGNQSTPDPVVHNWWAVSCWRRQTNVPWNQHELECTQQEALPVWGAITWVHKHSGKGSQAKDALHFNCFGIVCRKIKQWNELVDHGAHSKYANVCDWNNTVRN